jgi:2'-hydroxyisoflavone reductase
MPRAASRILLFTRRGEETPMTTTRRDFIHLSVVAGTALGMGSGNAAADPQPQVARASTRLRLLVLGGTGLIGPPLVRYAIARGHQVTLFNRGRTNTHLFPDLEKLRGDRSNDLGSIEAEVARGRSWDVVIDNTASIPRWVEGSARLLADAAGYYLFTSSISAYADHSRPGMDESAELGTIDLKQVAEVRSTADITGENFGPLKALCESSAQHWFPDRCIVVRPGLIVGPGDSSDRFTYWPVRTHRGGEVLAPGNPTDPVQFIDSRDLGEWYVRLAEKGAVGTYNATGPASRLSIAEMLYGIRAITSSEISFTWVDAEFLARNSVEPWSEMTVWMPPVDEYAGFALVSVDRARAAGLEYRPLADTARDTLDWWSSLDDERRAAPRAGLDSDKERDVLRAWHASIS